MIHKVGDAAKSVANKIKSFLHFSRPDEGPLRDYETWMPDMVEGMSKSLQNASPQIENQAKMLARDINSAIVGNIDDVNINGTTSNLTGSSSFNSSFNYINMVNAFKQALAEMKIEMDDEVMAKFVNKTVANEIYT